MIINSNMMGVTGGVSHSDFVRNAQHVGMQKTNGVKTEHEEPKNTQSSDSVSISFNQQTEESKETGKSQENGKANSASNTGTTQGTDQTQNADQAKNSSSAKENNSTPINLGSSSSPAAGELDFNEGAIGSNLLGGETSGETSTCTDLVPVNGGSGNGGSGSTDLVPVTGGPSTEIVPVGDSSTEVIPVVEGEVVDDGSVDFNQGMPGSTTETTESAASSTDNLKAQLEQQAKDLESLKELQALWDQIDAAWTEIMTAREKHMAEMWKMIQDTQNSIYEMFQQTIQAEAATRDRVFMGWDMVINGGGR